MIQLNCPESDLLYSEEDFAEPAQIATTFWQLWQQHQDYLYRCCVKWTGNPTDGEDALSQAMLKAWEKVQAGKGAIKNIKTWLTRLTHNVCIDIHRRSNQGGKSVDSLDGMDFELENQLVSQEENPVLAA